MLKDKSILINIYVTFIKIHFLKHLFFSKLLSGSQEDNAIYSYLTYLLEHRQLGFIYICVGEITTGCPLHWPVKHW